MIKEVYKSHKKWVSITETFGVSKSRAKDIVSEMYFHLYRKLKKGQDISYNGKPNYWYIYKMLRGIYIDYYRKHKKTEMLLLRIDNNGDVVFVNREGRYITKNVKKVKAPEIFDYDLHYKKYRKLIEVEKNRDGNLYFHKKHFQVYDEIEKSKLSITDYTRLNNKRYYSTYNSYIKAKEILKNKLINTL